MLNGVTLIEIGGTDRGAAVNGYDAINVGLNGTGSVILGGELQVVFFGGYVPNGSYNFQLIQAGSFGGSFAQVNLPTIAGYVWNTSQLSLDGTLSLVASAIPEPGSFAALASAFTRRRRRA